MENNKCFAQKDRECQILTDGFCTGRCGFYKTVEQHEKSSAASFARIAKLPYWEQRNISEHYYGGFYPWMSGELA